MPFEAEQNRNPSGRNQNLYAEMVNLKFGMRSNHSLAIWLKFIGLGHSDHGYMLTFNSQVNHQVAKPFFAFLVEKSD